MQYDIQPNYQEIKVVCSNCGNQFVTRSTKGDAELNIEICANCHPFYTGKQQKVSTKGRAERFRKRQGRGLAGRLLRNKDTQAEEK